MKPNNQQRNHCSFTLNHQPLPLCIWHCAKNLWEKCAERWGFCDQNKFYLPWSCDALDSRNVAPPGRETAPSEGRGQNQIVAYGCLLLLLSWMHTQYRHCARRIGIRRATMRQSRISEHECLMPLLLFQNQSEQFWLPSKWLMRWYWTD